MSDKKTDEFDYILNNITSLLTSEIDQLLLEQLGIGYSQYRVLSQISEQGIDKQNVIAHSLAQSEPSINRQLNILIDKSFVYKIVDIKDKKSKIIKLTTLGLRVKYASTEIVHTFNQKILSSLDAKTIKQLEIGLDYLQTNLFKKHKHIK